MTLAVIAGRGDLPAAVVGALTEAPLICAYEGVDPEGLAVDLRFRLETLGSLLVALGARGVTEVCLAGGIDRPVLDPEKLDAETAPLVSLFTQALQRGDDGALRVVRDLFEQTGFRVLGAHEIAPGLVARPGVHGEAWPNAQMRADAETGADKIARMSAMDVGQACVVAAGRVVAMEDSAGTDAMIAALGNRMKGKGAILFKGPKQDQIMAIDMPAIGPETFEVAAMAGLAGIVVDSGDVLVLHRERCTELADRYGIVFWSRTGE